MWWFIKEEIKDPVFHSGFLVGFLAAIGMIIIGASLAY